MPGPKRKTIEKRFWPKVERGMRCWLWTGAKNKMGYGYIGAGGQYARALLAHRVSWEIHFGPIPEGLVICHHCDNPSCVNPAHLFMGTHAHNSRDAVRKRRMAHGVKHYRAKLDDIAVMDIRNRARAGDSEREIAAIYGVSPGTIHKVLDGTNWKHVGQEK